jgi:hypothetical protein
LTQVKRPPAGGHTLVGMFSWHRPRELGELNLWKFIEKSATRHIAARQPDVLERAVETCRGCRRTRNCDALLASGRDAGLETYCPNVMYLRHLEAMKRHEPRRALIGPDA